MTSGQRLDAVLELTVRQLARAAAGPARIAELAADRVARADGLAGEEPGSLLTVLVGEPGSGRTTELAALAVRRSGGAAPLPTLWLRGADLRPGDRGPLPAAERALGAPLAAAAACCTEAGRPLLVLLDGPEEAPAALDADWWTEALRQAGQLGLRLLVACRPESGEHLADRARLHRLGPLHGEDLARAAARFGVPVPPAPADPLLLRLAVPLHRAGLDTAAAGFTELADGWLDLHCLRIARRIATADRPASHRRGRPTAPAPGGAAPEPPAGALRRLAAAVAGRVHEAARRMLGAGQGSLGPADFAELFPAAGGWERAVLAEGLLVPAGDGYRLAHEAVADWLQGRHLDLAGALARLLTARERPGVPRHRVGAVAAALRGLGERHGAAALDPWLHRLRQVLDDPAAGGEPHWWAARLLRAGLLGSPDPAAHGDLLDRLADRLAADGPNGPLTGFGPAFWEALALSDRQRWALLGLLVRADGPEQAHLRSAAARLRTEGPAAFAHLCGWFTDGRGLSARPGSTVADLAQDLLYAHRALAVDELTEVLVAAAHPRADALLTVLAVEEPSALCRAVDRWSHDGRPERHVAAAVHGLRTAPYAGPAGRRLLRFAALALLAREDEPGLRGAALALLVRDPVTRAGHLAAALAAYAADDPFVTPEVLATALRTDQAAVLTAFEARLARPGAAVAPVLRVLAEQPPPTADGGPVPSGLPDPATRLVGRLLRGSPERAELVADYLSHRLALGTAGPGDLTALLGANAEDRPVAVRRAFALVLAQPAERDPQRREFLDRLLATERDPAVLEPLLQRVAQQAGREEGERSRAVVRRITDAWSRGEGGPTRLDALLVRCAGSSAAFALLLADWPAEARPPAGGALLARMRELLARGRDPQYAAAEAERLAFRPVIAAQAGPAGVPVPGRPGAHGRL